MPRTTEPKDERRARGRKASRRSRTEHTYDYHGYPISDDLLPALGRGLGFV